MPRLRSNRGFTLLEMIITVAIMAILVSLTMPAIFEYLRQRDDQVEELNLTEIRKALQAYLSHNGSLPSDTASGTDIWYKKLAGYTSLSEDEIAYDVFGRLRWYIMYENTSREMFGNPVSVYYATVHSSGTNGDAENTYKDGATTVTIDGIGVKNKAFQSVSAGAWWRKKSTPDDIVTSFSALRPGGDDHLMRFTNYSGVLDSYNLTVQRLDTITQALETYARSRYAERVSTCVTASNTAICKNGLPEKTIYYPRGVPTVTTPATHVETVTGTPTVIYNVTTDIVDNRKTDAARRTDMEKLMDLLGLPRENCCSALKTSLTDNKPMPFYYFSNPRPRTTSGCSPRPKTDDAKLPARVTTENTSTTCG